MGIKVSQYLRNTRKMQIYRRILFVHKEQMANNFGKYTLETPLGHSKCRFSRFNDCSELANGLCCSRKVIGLFAMPLSSLNTF